LKSIGTLYGHLCKNS